MQHDLVARLYSELEQQADANTIGNSQSFFKEPIKFHGVKISMVNQIARQSFQEVKNLGKQEIFRLAEALMQTDYNEETFIAFDWIYRLRDQYQPEDMICFTNWIDKYINNWAKCDTLCNHALGAFMEKYPEYLANLKLWAKSANRWTRRAAAVTLILPARKGLFLTDVLEIADILLCDKDDLVQKGYGWMLKEASKQHQQEVYNYIVRNKAYMPRTALRYAIEKMPGDLRRAAMAKDTQA